MNDERHERFVELRDWLASLLPANLSDNARKVIRGEIINNLLDFRDKECDDFCRRNDLCPICITGGWGCGSDHK